MAGGTCPGGRVDNPPKLPKLLRVKNRSKKLCRFWPWPKQPDYSDGPLCEGGFFLLAKAVRATGSRT